MPSFDSPLQEKSQLLSQIEQHIILSNDKI